MLDLSILLRARKAKAKVTRGGRTRRRDQQVAESPNPQERGLNLNVGTGELQACVIQLGRIADLLQELVNLLKANPPIRPQPFGQ